MRVVLVTAVLAVVFGPVFVLGCLPPVDPFYQPATNPYDGTPPPKLQADHVWEPSYSRCIRQEIEFMESLGSVRGPAGSGWFLDGESITRPFRCPCD